MNETVLHGLILGFAMMITLLSAYGVFSPAGLTKTVFGVFDKPYTMPLAVGVLNVTLTMIIGAPL